MKFITLILFCIIYGIKQSVPNTLNSVKNCILFYSASHDQTAMLWEWNVVNNAVECVHVCRGHERGLECVAVDPQAKTFATGGWDALLKIWSAGGLKTKTTTFINIYSLRTVQLVFIVVWLF